MTQGRPAPPRLTRQGPQLSLPDDVTGDVAPCADGSALDALVCAPGLLVATAGDDETPPPWLACELSVLSAPELCTVILGAKHTGVLEITDARARRRLFFESGDYTGSMSTHAEDRLGEVIWREGRISLDQLVIASESLEGGKRIGRHLVDLGYLEPHELHEYLRRQARAVFFAACLEPAGHASFLSDHRHPNPVRFGPETEALLDEAVGLWAECKKLQRDIEPGHALAKPVVPAPPGKLSEAQEAMLQLANSAKTPLTRDALLERTSLGRLHGLRALRGLLAGGYFAPVEATPAPLAARRTRVARLAEAVNAVMYALRDVGGGTGPVREFLRSPPPHLADALAGINLDEALDAEALELQATFATGGREAMEAGLLILLDFALFEARDTFAEEPLLALEDEVSALDVF